MGEKVLRERKQRTNIDFSEYDVITTESEGLLIHWLKKPDTIHGNIKFINTNNIMAVTGDYGNWIFCREFHPSANGAVSDGYWCEKLTIASSQKPMQYDAREMRRELEERLQDDDFYDGEKEWLEGAMSHAEDGEFWCITWLVDNLPSGMDCESLPNGQKMNPWLNCIFDGFNEICRRIEVTEGGE